MLRYSTNTKKAPSGAFFVFVYLSHVLEEGSHRISGFSNISG
jgi:hypothetical protein